MKFCMRDHADGRCCGVVMESVMIKASREEIGYRDTSAFKNWRVCLAKVGALLDTPVVDLGRVRGAHGHAVVVVTAYKYRIQVQNTSTGYKYWIQVQDTVQETSKNTST